ncbi:hypothetical protein [Thermomonospora umbrina]|uniref:Uncharacterized protein n=1 Tax=Thermomonospora umbrina TaxID=111806 RepID=A0A3D9SQN7_9ACTN|nr:hypothetical protein [Thermomonospora umbrina]REE94904.1 hypothetical protein DFJ69_0273 [Thermomonospora umbrina]
MRTETFTGGRDVFARFPGARVCGRVDGAITYLAESGGLPYLLVVEGGGAVTVLAFEDEAERARHLSGRVAAGETRPRAAGSAG